MAKVLLTGSGGVIGTVLRADLNHQITEYDLPKRDVGDLPQLMRNMDGLDSVIHLAWGKHHDDWLTERFDPANLEGAFNVLEAAQQTSVKRVILASSVHADDFVNNGKHGLLKAYDLPTPDSPYGAAKCMIEAMGRYYASSKNIEVICIRFGGINKNDKPPRAPKSERQVWLSQRDCSILVDHCLKAKSVPGNFAIVYAVGNNKDRLHDLSNPFGWEPLDGVN